MCIALGLAGLACPLPPAGDSATEPGTDDPDTSTGSPTTGTSSSSGDDGSTGGSTDTPTGTSDTSLCGNGVVDDGEPCDDGNRVNADGCNRDCTFSGALVWEFRSDIFVVDEFDAVAVAPDGSIYAAGQWLGEGRWLTRFDEHGQGQWSRTYNTAQFDSIHGLAVDDAAVYAAGAFRDGDRDAWLARLDLDGEVVWEQIVDSALGDDYWTAIARVPGGDVVVTGLASVDGGLAVLRTRRYGADGGEQWTQDLPIGKPPLYRIGPAIELAGDQLVVGFHHAPQPDTLEQLLLAYPHDGAAPLWTRTASSEDPVIGLAHDPGGDIFVTDRLTPLRRLTGTGKPLWTATHCEGAGGMDAGVDSQGDIVVAGFGAGNIRLCKFAPDGSLRWDREIDGKDGTDFAAAVALYPDDRIVVAGQVEHGDVPDAWLAMLTP